VRLTWRWVDRVCPDAESARSREHARAIRLDIRDTGVGIAAEDQEAIWDEFRQVRPTSPEGQQGSGLGLALTRRLVTVLGGVIGLHSAPGQGSTFTVVLPCALTPPSEKAPPPGNGRPLALVIEDHGPTCRLLCDWLNEAGLATASAADGAV